VESAEVDHRGELLRIRVASPTDVHRVTELLQTLGFLGEVLANASDDVTRWYDVRGVGDLSREEADVIAQRVVPPFIRQHAPDLADSNRVRDLAASAMHQCFLTQTDSAGTLQVSCGRAVAEATRAMLGDEKAEALGAAIESDMAARSAFKE